LPDAVSNAIWNRERERELLEVSRLQSEAADAMGARGFNLPSGIFFDERARIAQAGADRIAAASRDRAIQDGQTRLDMLKFALEKGVQMRLGILDGLVSYLNTWLKLPALAIEKARTLADAKTKLWESSAAYYRALIAVSELILRVEEINVNRMLGMQQNDVRNFEAKIKARVEAAVGAAEAMGNIGAAAMGSINALGSLNNDTIESVE